MKDFQNIHVKISWIIDKSGSMKGKISNGLRDTSKILKEHLESKYTHYNITIHNAVILFSDHQPYLEDNITNFIRTIDFDEEDFESVIDGLNFSSQEDLVEAINDSLEQNLKLRWSDAHHNELRYTILLTDSYPRMEVFINEIKVSRTENTFGSQIRQLINSTDLKLKDNLNTKYRSLIKRDLIYNTDIDSLKPIDDCNAVYKILSETLVDFYGGKCPRNIDFFEVLKENLSQIKNKIIIGLISENPDIKEIYLALLEKVKFDIKNLSILQFEPNSSKELVDFLKELIINDMKDFLENRSDEQKIVQYLLDNYNTEEINNYFSIDYKNLLDFLNQNGFLPETFLEIYEKNREKYDHDPLFINFDEQITISIKLKPKNILEVKLDPQVELNIPIYWELLNKTKKQWLCGEFIPLRKITYDIKLSEKIDLANCNLNIYQARSKNELKLFKKQINVIVKKEKSDA